MASTKILCLNYNLKVTFITSEPKVTLHLEGKLCYIFIHILYKYLFYLDEKLFRQQMFNQPDCVNHRHLFSAYHYRWMEVIRSATQQSHIPINFAQKENYG